MEERDFCTATIFSEEQAQENRISRSKQLNSGKKSAMFVNEIVS